MRWFKLILKISLSLSLLAVFCITGAVYHFSKGLPQLNSLSDYQPPLVSRVYNTKGELIAEYADEHRILTPMSEIPDRVRNAFLAAEDEHFYEHPGINPARILAAALANFKAGRTVQGASTITQQVAKNFLLTKEKSYIRKIKEAILSWRIEQDFTKDEILYLYLNHIFLGRGSYGVTSASWRYFHKNLDELTLGEAAMLAGLPKAPSAYAPHVHPKRALQRRNTILNQLKRSGLASPRDVNVALNEPLIVAPLIRRKLTNAYANLVHEQLINTFGRTALRRQGLNIVVPYDEAIENAAIHAVRHGVLNVERLQAYQTPPNHNPETWEGLLAAWAERITDEPLAADMQRPALVQEVMHDGSLLVHDGKLEWLLSPVKWKWQIDINLKKENPTAKIKPHYWQAGDEIMLRGDGNDGVAISQKPSIQSALYSIDLNKGTVLARVGGFDYKFGDFDRVSQAKRQPGSSFKPFLYTTAIEKGYTPASIVVDAPIVFSGGSTDDFWRPENYGNRFAGPVTLRNALEHSRNLVAVRVLQDIGINTFLRRLRDYPFEQKFPKQLALALGVAEVTPEHLVESYVVIASGGLRYKPVALQQVQDRNGQTLHRSVAGNRCQVCHVDPVFAVNESMRPAERILDKVDAFLVQNMMTGVIKRGTARKAVGKHFKRPAAGKTGTTNKQIDAWFMGFTPQVLTGVWVGKDNPAPMGRKATGGGAAAPIWLETMQAIHQGLEVADFPVPEHGIEWASIDYKTGLLAGPSTKYPFLEAFREGTAPNEISPDTRVETNDSDSPSTSQTDFFDTEL
ncbi:MAG TPA: PBP1A family penicillin-binding protein [Ghiorsea sp.]|nr:PBP1A family penicillin-binding protein [Ghiorsea sp.]HIP07640.1 PBP1A family penicillin-binding protein [Mariprofundaceae bacterium]